MKRVVFVIVIVAVAGFLGMRFGSVTSSVEFSFVHEDKRRLMPLDPLAGAAAQNLELDFSQASAQARTPLEPVRFALIADIHMREDPRQEITGEQQTRTILQQFIDRMNRDVRPDFIVQLGDLNDGCLVVCTGISDELIIERIERALAYTEHQTEIPWFNVIGNHEYSSAYDARLNVIPNKDYGAIYRAIDKNWSRHEDTWYYRDIKGYRFVFLNTSFPYEGVSHLVPPAQIEWLKQVLESTSQPLFVFMHVPISAGVGTAYDFAVNQEKVSRLLAADDSFVAGFFGHSHHSDKWDGLRRQLDEAGNVFYHTTAPHQWMGNASSYPWTIVDIDPAAGRISIETGSLVHRSEISEFWHYSVERITKSIARLVRGWR